MSYKKLSVVLVVFLILADWAYSLSFNHQTMSQLHHELQIENYEESLIYWDGWDRAPVGMNIAFDLEVPDGLDLYLSDLTLYMGTKAQDQAVNAVAKPKISKIELETFPNQENLNGAGMSDDPEFLLTNTLEGGKTYRVRYSLYPTVVDGTYVWWQSPERPKKDEKICLRDFKRPRATGEELIAYWAPSVEWKSPLWEYALRMAGGLFIAHVNTDDLEWEYVSMGYKLKEPMLSRGKLAQHPKLWAQLFAAVDRGGEAVGHYQPCKKSGDIELEYLPDNTVCYCR